MVKFLPLAWHHRNLLYGFLLTNWLKEVHLALSNFHIQLVTNWLIYISKVFHYFEEKQVIWPQVLYLFNHLATFFIIWFEILCYKKQPQFDKRLVCNLQAKAQFNCAWQDVLSNIALRSQGKKIVIVFK